jgi:very-short-patch-repair endonuclease
MQEVERAIARIAGAQDNVIGREQLIAVGLGRGAIEHRVRAHWMQRMHQGVYLIGPAAPTRMARARAAAIACGDEAVISHRSAAGLHGLLAELGGEIDVTVVGRNAHRQAGIRLHRVSRMASQDVVTMSGLRITSIARTVCDLAATEPHGDVMHVFQEALYRRVLTPRALAAVLAREPRRKGAPVIQGLIDDPRMTRSDRERLLLRLIDRGQLPKPLTNVRLHGYLVDVLWPAEKLIVEFDGWRGHGHRLAFEKDRKRDQVLLAAGYRVLRVTDRQLKEEPLAVLARIAQALRA